MRTESRAARPPRQAVRTRDRARPPPGEVAGRGRRRRSGAQPAVGVCSPTSRPSFGYAAGQWAGAALFDLVKAYDKVRHGVLAEAARAELANSLIAEAVVARVK